MANDQKPVISVRKLRKVYMMGQEHVVALHNIDLDIPRGEVCCIFGTSGSGKSTLLNQLAGLEKPTRGVVRIGGVPISRLNENQLAAFRQKHIGFVFQSYNLLPELTAAENVAMPLMFKGIDPDVRLLEAKKMLCRVGLKDRMDHFPNQMSGGQQQRVAVARALVMNPELLLLDEPLSNLDAKLRESVRVELRDIQQKMGLSTIYVTHDQSEALSMSDRIVVLKDGIVHQVGTPQEIYFEPKTPFVADFIGTTNLIEVKGAAENTVLYGSVQFASGNPVKAGKTYCASIRPESAKLSKEPVEGRVNVPAVIFNKMFLGEKVRYFVRDELGKEWIVDMFDPGRTILEGRCCVTFPSDRAWVIEADADA